MPIDITKARAFVAEKERRRSAASRRKLRRARSNFPIDIVQPEKMAPEFRELIVAEGKLVYGRPQ